MRQQGSAAKTEVRSTRDVILDVAERQFAERGFAGVSMRAIAAEAGLRNQASLYNHFPGKRALYEAMLARGVEPILALVSRAGEMPRDEVLDRIVDVLVEHPNLPRLIQRAGLDDIRHLAGTVTQLLRPLYTQGMQALAGKGRFWERSELPHLGAGIYHIIFGYFANATLFEAVLGEDLQGEAAVGRQRRFVKAAVARLLGPELVGVGKDRRRS